MGMVIGDIITHK